MQFILVHSVYTLCAINLFKKNDQLVAEAATYTTKNRRTSMPSAEFETAIPTIKRQLSYIFDRTATSIGNYVLTFYICNLHVHPAHMCVVPPEEFRHDACDDYTNTNKDGVYKCMILYRRYHKPFFSQLLAAGCHILIT
jgi:hypothetical protein